jgi:hypothetical protein
MHSAIPCDDCGFGSTLRREAFALSWPAARGPGYVSHYGWHPSEQCFVRREDARGLCQPLGAEPHDYEPLDANDALLTQQT